MIRTKCLNCQAEIQLGTSPEIGQQATCPACHSSFEVVWLFPIELDYANDSEWPADAKSARPDPDSHFK